MDDVRGPSLIIYELIFRKPPIAKSSFARLGIMTFVIIASLIISVPLTASAQSIVLSATTWVGESDIDGETTFIRVSPQLFAGPEPFFNRPNDLVFNQEMQGFSVDETAISFDILDDAEVITYDGTFDGSRYNGTVQGGTANGTFYLHPVVNTPDSTILSSYSGNYEIGNRRYRTVGYEDFTGFFGLRPYYSDGNNFVVMYPISDTDFITGFGERISFVEDNGAISGMTIVDADGEQSAPKVSLYTEEEVSYESGDATIAATLFIPDASGPHAAVIIVHSSEPGERHGWWQYASQIAQDGIAVLVYDRRGQGLSTGARSFNYDTDILAGDLKSGFAYLQSRSDIDPNRIGLMGFSNGSWVTPRAAQDLPDIAFIGVAMASAVSQVDSELFRREVGLRAVGVSEDSIDQAMEVWRGYFKHTAESALSETEWAEFVTMYEEIGNNVELQGAVGIRLVPTDIPLEDIEAGGSSQTFMNFDPTDVYMNTDAPIAFFMGDLDENIPPELTIPAMEEVITQRPDADITFVVYPDTQHSMYVLPGTVEGISQDFIIAALASYEFAPGFIGQMRSWLVEKTALPPENTTQPTTSRPVVSPSVGDARPTPLMAFGMVIIGFGLITGGGIIFRRRKHKVRIG